MYSLEYSEIYVNIHIDNLILNTGIEISNSDIDFNLYLFACSSYKILEIRYPDQYLYRHRSVNVGPYNLILVSKIFKIKIVISNDASN